MWQCAGPASKPICIVELYYIVNIVTLFKRIWSWAIEAMAATNQQSPSIPCDTSKRLAPPVKSWGLETISYNEYSNYICMHDCMDVVSYTSTSIDMCTCFSLTLGRIHSGVKGNFWLKNRDEESAGKQGSSNSVPLTKHCLRNFS